MVDNDNDDDGDKAIPKHTNNSGIELYETIWTGCSGAGWLVVKQKLSANNLKRNQFIYLESHTFNCNDAEVTVTDCPISGQPSELDFENLPQVLRLLMAIPQLHWSHGNLRAAACVTPRFVQKVWKTSPQAITKSDTSNLHSQMHFISNINRVRGWSLFSDFGGCFSDHGSANPPLGLP